MNIIDLITSALTGIAVAIVVICIILVVPWVFQVCWNFTMTYMFGLPEIAYWHSFALISIIFILSKILFEK